jgi:hypothetical protein
MRLIRDDRKVNIDKYFRYDSNPKNNSAYISKERNEHLNKQIDNSPKRYQFSSLKPNLNQLTQDKQTNLYS